MSYVLGILGTAASALMVVFRLKLGDIIGEADWMRKIGGIYVFIVLLALGIFLWSLATLTGTQDLWLQPLLYLLPGARRSPGVPTGADF